MSLCVSICQDKSIFYLEAIGKFSKIWMRKQAQELSLPAVHHALTRENF